MANDEEAAHTDILADSRGGTGSLLPMADRPRNGARDGAHDGASDGAGNGGRGAGGAGAVTVLFFASAREAAGTGRTSAEAAGLTVEQLLDDLCRTYGEGLRAVLASCAVWVNRSPEPRDTVLRAGDEVAVLPPVSGG